MVKDFPGNYSEYRQWKYDSEAEAEELAKELKATENAIQQPTAPAVDVKIPETPKAPVVEKKKLSFKEQKELETLDVELPKLEARKSEIENLLAGGISDVEAIEKLSNEFTLLSNELEEKTMRWLELQD